jgi:hypothetical protein
MTTTTTDLRAEANAEVRRLTAARALLREGDQDALGQLEADSPWIATTRGAKRRRSAGRRVWLVWRVAFEDAFGRVVESQLVPIVIELSAVPGKAQRRAWIRALVRHVDAMARARIESHSEGWRDAVERVVRPFASARVSRERGIAALFAESTTQAFQPGLFDRRAERARASWASAAAAGERGAGDRRGPHTP